MPSSPEPDTSSGRPSEPWIKGSPSKQRRFPSDDVRHDPNEWISLLEHGLPPHLREAPRLESSVELDVGDIAELLLAAQRVRVVNSRKGIDLLFVLGIKRGRWDAAVWLVKRLVETFGTSQPHPEKLLNTSAFSQSQLSLDHLTETPVDIHSLGQGENGPPIPSHSGKTLHDLTNDLKPENLSRRDRLQHDTLGQIWRSLGQMVMACSDGEVKPEILEIIAYLHHMGIMPSSIYNQKPASDVISIQQPPTLNLFSSRILTSLSDAAWRAHERTIVEEAKSKGGEYASLRPEIPGSAYRVHVAGLRPEIWLELILWSCLHGGWILEGSDILLMIYSEQSSHPWKPFSWRSSIPDVGDNSPDWDTLSFIFNTKAVDSSDPLPADSVHKTISSEVVNAYVDALLSASRLGVGERGIAPVYVSTQLKMLQRFLDRSGLSLGAGTWDTVLVRFFDAHDHFVDHSQTLRRLVDISPAIGGELKPNLGPNLPAYILDGSAALLGLFHRAIGSRVKQRDAPGALRIFQMLLDRADENKRRSIVDFLEKQSPSSSGSSTEEPDLFTSNFPGIDYPAFDVHLPPTVLAPFLELVADVKAYEFGRWLLYSNEIDGPVISENMYRDPVVAPALFRFASETNDKELLDRLLQARALPAKYGHVPLPKAILQAMFDRQVQRCQWEAATRVLEHMMETKWSHWSTANLAQVVRVMLLKFHDSWAGQQSVNQDFNHAMGLFLDMLQGKYERLDRRPHEKQEQITNLLTILSVVDKFWARVCEKYIPSKTYFPFKLPTAAFNLVLEGIVQTYSAAFGRRVLGIFWSHAVRKMQQSGMRTFGDDAGEPFIPRTELGESEIMQHLRTVIRVPTQPRREIIIYGGLRPDIMTIRIILRRALKELNTPAAVGDHNSTLKSSLIATPAQSDTDFNEDSANGTVDDSPFGMVVWAVACLRSQRMIEEDIMEELQAVLSEHKMYDLQTRLPTLFEAKDDPESGTYNPFNGDV